MNELVVAMENFENTRLLSKAGRVHNTCTHDDVIK